MLGVAVFVVYLLVDGWRGAGMQAANANGREILAVERAVHLDVERALNSWLAARPTLRVIANYEYAITYVVSALALLVWVYLRRGRLYRRVRTSFVLINLIAMACFALYPVTPPRMLSDAGFVDTVRLGHTWGSWGSPLVQNANQLAAMPSLHVAWALWVSVVLALISGRWYVQVISALHVLLTLVVIMATGNHYWLDAVGAAVLVWASTALAGVSGRRGWRVPASDTFFLHIESPMTPQHVGGLVMLDTAAAGRTPTRAEVESAVRARLDTLPRFRERLSRPSRWLRPRWVAHPDLDWQWHVPWFDLSGRDGRPGGLAAVHELVADLAAQPLPMDRPLWRLAFVTGIDDGVAAVVLLVHHAVADGIGTITLAMRLLDPPMPLPGGNGAKRPGPVRKTVATVVGLAQLATDGWPTGRLADSGSAARRFDTLGVPLDSVRAIARAHGVRVTDVLLCGIAGALSRVAAGALPPRLTVAVPLIASELRKDAAGNLTAAVMVRVPLAEMPEHERLAAIARASGRLRSGSRALASRFVMHTVGNLMPPILHSAFARTFYGGRVFHGIASNMPGADRQLTHVGIPVITAFPIVPLAPSAPFAIGAIGWNGLFALGATVDPALVDDAGALTGAILDVLDSLRDPRHWRP